MAEICILYQHNIKVTHSLSYFNQVKNIYVTQPFKDQYFIHIKQILLYGFVHSYWKTILTEIWFTVTHVENACHIKTTKHSAVMVVFVKENNDTKSHKNVALKRLITLSYENLETNI
jgi:hypothetical protein